MHSIVKGCTCSKRTRGGVASQRRTTEVHSPWPPSMPHSATPFCQFALHRCCCTSPTTAARDEGGRALARDVVRASGYARRARFATQALASGLPTNGPTHRTSAPAGPGSGPPSSPPRAGRTPPPKTRRRARPRASPGGGAPGARSSGAAPSGARPPRRGPGRGTPCGASVRVRNDALSRRRSPRNENWQAGAMRKDCVLYGRSRGRCSPQRALGESCGNFGMHGSLVVAWRTVVIVNTASTMMIVQVLFSFVCN